MLLDDKPDTEPVFKQTREHVARGFTDPRKDTPLTPGEVDHIVQRFVADCCGRMYIPLINKLPRYPIPQLRMNAGDGRRFLDIGCAWGRWSLAAARIGACVVGIDPSIYDVFAARRVAAQLGHAENIYLVADGRFLPFDDACFDTAFSYSCLQHMSEDDMRLVLREIRRTLKPCRSSLIEMPNKWGLRNLYVQAKRGFRTPSENDVRYHTPRRLKEIFRECIGPTKLLVDGFFTINPQVSDLDILPTHYKFVVMLSEGLRIATALIPGLTYLADSLYVHSSREAPRSGS
jgi:SAM-dependent methyltransferase